MDLINVVIADLELALALLKAKDPDEKRLKTVLAAAAADLAAATKALVGEQKGGGET